MKLFDFDDPRIYEREEVTLPCGTKFWVWRRIAAFTPEEEKEIKRQDRRRHKEGIVIEINSEDSGEEVTAKVTKAIKRNPVDKTMETQ
jgi:hypothetical protein